ncbi:DUF6603 domain-containing protein [Granulicoccus phenolivorans]|uniref:DUF6603 domain-containing protein n=1 Tax=Granulicoccus phenolivorans TaxID=266854 RepID=UPI0003FC3760|nr:DUF6603 domain-containing protein [Granulicoccus phenolivorans]
MALDPGRELLAFLQREVVTAFRDAVRQAVSGLGALEPDPTVAGTPFAGKILTPVDSPDPVLAALGLLTGRDGSTTGELRFWRDPGDPGPPDGIAYLLRSGSTLVALVVRPDAPAPLALRLAGVAGGRTLSLPLTAGVTLRLSTMGDADEIAVALPVDGPPQVERLDSASRVDVAVGRTAGTTELGIPGGPSVQIGAFEVGGHLAATLADPFERTAHLEIVGGRVTLAPSFVGSLLPVDLSFPLDLRLRAAPESGLQLNGSSALRTRLSGGAAAPDLGTSTGRWLDVAVQGIDQAGSSVTVAFASALEASLPGLPVDIRIDGLGIRVPVGLRPGAGFLPAADALGVDEPRGIDLALTLPLVSGAGGLTRSGDDLVGVLGVRIPPVQATAFGVLTPAAPGRPLSLLVSVGATFPPPGIQIGFGFAISGVGGMVGINRRIDRDALVRAITDGSAAQLLFPADPGAAGRTAIDALPRLFPVARGSLLVGPMFQLSWGGRLVTASVAVLVESAAQVRLTILGTVVVAIPDPAVPLILLQATFAGFIDPAEPSVMFVASLTGSHIVGVALSGDLLLLARGGDDPTFVLSAGGFHPAFTPPRGVPALRRLAMDLSPVSWLDLRCEAYVAITSNTIQLGARLELRAEVAGCGLRGWLAFDAMVQFEPFRFVADMSGGIALRAFGRNLVGIALSLHLEGPAPYLARGRGSIDLFLFEVSLDFEIGWGSPAPALAAPFDIGQRLRDALAGPSAWRARGTPPAGVRLTAAAQQALNDALLVDTGGAVGVRQEVVPLGVSIERINGVPIPAQTWNISAGEFGPGQPAGRTVEITAPFAPGLFLPSRTDDEALTRPAYVALRAGVELHPDAETGPDERAVAFDWEERVIARDVPRPVTASAGHLLDLSTLWTLAESVGDQDPGWWQPPEQVVTVAEQPPLSLAYSWSMAPAGPVDAATALGLAQSPSGELRTLEAWEVTGG